MFALVPHLTFTSVSILLDFSALWGLLQLPCYDTLADRNVDIRSQFKRAYILPISPMTLFR